MSELGDIAEWMNILLPVVIPIVSIAFVYMKKVDKTVINLQDMKKDVEQLKRDVQYLMDYRLKGTDADPANSERAPSRYDHTKGEWRHSKSNEEK